MVSRLNSLPLRGAGGETAIDNERRFRREVERVVDELINELTAVKRRLAAAEAELVLHGSRLDDLEGP